LECNSNTTGTASNDNTLLADILQDSFDHTNEHQSQSYKKRARQLEENDLYKDTELKKKYGDKVINALDIAAGNIHIGPYTVEEVLNVMRGFTIGKALEILGERQLEFPFHGRDDARKEIYQTVIMRMKERRSRDKEASVVMQVAGCPGLGKTRINVETQNMLRIANDQDSSISGAEFRKLLGRSLFITLTYNNSIHPTDQEMHLKTAAYGFWCRVIFF
jgi:hypothetical protein